MPSEGLVQTSPPHRVAVAWPTCTPAAPLVDGSHPLPSCRSPAARDLSTGYSTLKRPAPTFQYLWPADNGESSHVLSHSAEPSLSLCLPLLAKSQRAADPWAIYICAWWSGQQPILRVAREKNRSVRVILDCSTSLHARFSLSCACLQSPYCCSLSIGSGSTAREELHVVPVGCQDFLWLNITALQAPDLCT